MSLPSCSINMLADKLRNSQTIFLYLWILSGVDPVFFLQEKYSVGFQF